MNEIEKDVEIIEIKDVSPEQIDGIEIETKKISENPESSPEIPKRKRGRPRKVDIEKEQIESARKILNDINVFLPNELKLKDTEIEMLVTTGKEKIIRIFGKMQANGDFAFYMTVTTILLNRMPILRKYIENIKKILIKSSRNEHKTGGKGNENNSGNRTDGMRENDTFDQII